MTAYSNHPRLPLASMDNISQMSIFSFNMSSVCSTCEYYFASIQTNPTLLTAIVRCLSACSSNASVCVGVAQLYMPRNSLRDRPDPLRDVQLSDEIYVGKAKRWRMHCDEEHRACAKLRMRACAYTRDVELMLSSKCLRTRTCMRV
jgi:hypothetical protein